MKSFVYLPSYNVYNASAPASSFTTTWAKTIKMEEKQVDQQQPKHNHETTLRYYGMRVSEFSVCVSPSSNMQPQLCLLLFLHVCNYPDHHHHQKESRCPSTHIEDIAATSWLKIMMMVLFMWKIRRLFFK